MFDLLFAWVYDLLYILQKSICYILDFIREIFNKLVGIETVSINGKEEDLLTHFILSSGVRNAFLGVFLVGVILLFVFVMIAIVKAEATDPQHKKTKGQILAKSLESFVMFLLIPFFLIAGILLTNAIMGAISASMTGAMIDGNSNTLIGGQILVTSGHDAFNDWFYPRQETERLFITGQLDYNNLNTVKKYYNLADMNFFVGIAGGLVILVMFVMSAIMFVQRIFDIVLLYIVSPASVSTIPLDDGGRFRIWREMIISKILGAYGIILSMNLFFLIIPQVSKISFFGDSFKDGVVQLLFVLGGAFAITKANMVISQLTGSNAGAQEAQQMLSNIHSGIHMAKTTGHVAAGAAGMVIGGTDFLHNRKRGASFGENVSATVHSQRNRRQSDSNDNDSANSSSSTGGFPVANNTVQETSVMQNANRSSAENNIRNASGTDNGIKDTRPNEQASDGTINADNIPKATTTDSKTLGTRESTFAESSTAEMNDNQNATDNAAKPKGLRVRKIGAAAKGTSRMATLPAGVLKDLIQGGVVVAGKNFMPRLRNVLNGKSVVNHAEVKSSVAGAGKKPLPKERKKYEINSTKH